MLGFHLPFVEIGIGLSIVALGVAVALRLSVPVTAAAAFVGFFAIFHGYGARRRNERRGQLVTQFAGAGMAAAGIAILSGAI